MPSKNACVQRAQCVQCAQCVQRAQCVRAVFTVHMVICQGQLNLKEKLDQFEIL